LASAEKHARIPFSDNGLVKMGYGSNVEILFRHSDSWIL
jgi:hypothetical protein